MSDKIISKPLEQAGQDCYERCFGKKKTQSESETIHSVSLVYEILDENEKRISVVQELLLVKAPSIGSCASICGVAYQRFKKLLLKDLQPKG